MRNETRQIMERYSRRSRSYSPLDPAVFMSRQELERSLIIWAKEFSDSELHDARLLEIGCGHGFNLLQFIRLGFAPENLVGNELLPERANHARRILPAATEVVEGDALDLQFEAGSFDVVFQSLVFSSILDCATQEELAQMMWRLVRRGGGVLWYDFTFDNPANNDVKGVPRRRITELFPEGSCSFSRVTLAPPISRIVSRVHYSLYSVFNMMPLLRTHCLCWIRKR